MEEIKMGMETTPESLLGSISNLEQQLHGDDVEKSQILTGPGSSKGNLKEEPQGEADQWSDDIADNGTDYNRRGKGGKARKAMRAETEEEEEETDTDMPEEEEEKSVTSKKTVDEREDIEKQLGRGGAGLAPSVGMGAPGTGGSFRRSIEVKNGDDYTPGLEVSEFLHYLGKSVRDALDDMQTRLLMRMRAHHAQRAEYAKSVAEVIVGIDDTLSKSESNVEVEESAPAHMAKSITTTEQSTSPQQTLESVMGARKAILNEMTELFENGNEVIKSMDVIKFESAQGIGPIRPEVRALLKSVEGIQPTA
jgi:hypothetical protein